MEGNKFNTHHSNSTLKDVVENNDSDFVEFKDESNKKTDYLCQTDDDHYYGVGINETKEAEYLSNQASHQFYSNDSHSKEKYFKYKQMNVVDRVVKYLNNRKNLPFYGGLANSGKLITSNGVQINRGRMLSNTNASTSSQSGSRQRKKVKPFSNSIERNDQSKKEDESACLFDQKNGSKILIQNFLDNLNHRLDQNNKESLTKRENSVDSAIKVAKGFNWNIGNSCSSLRKSYDQQSFPKMMQEDPYKKFQISSYQERRNLRLREKSNTRTEASQGRNKNESVIREDEDNRPIVKNLRKSYEFSTSNFANHNSLSFNSKSHRNNLSKQEKSGQIDSNLKWAVQNMQNSNEVSEDINEWKVDIIQNSLKQRINKIFRKDASAVPVISPDKENPFSINKSSEWEYNWNEVVKNSEIIQPSNEIEHAYSTTASRKYFRLEDEKGSKSINVQQNLIKPLLEIIEEDVAQEQYKLEAADEDQSINEEWIDFQKNITIKKPGRSLTKELPKSKIKSSKFITSQKQSTIQVVEVFL